MSWCVQDTKGVLDLLSEMVTIRFQFRPDRLVQYDEASGRINLTFDRDEVSESAMAATTHNR